MTIALIIEPLFIVGVALTVLLVVGLLFFVVSFYKKVPQGRVLVRTGSGGTNVSFDTGMLVLPVLHLCEEMDISLKKIEIQRLGKDGLICKDNLRADIKVVFFVRVNKRSEDVIRVAQTIGCERASAQETLVILFDAKFSEALKTVGKQFDFVELYNSRERFKQEILNTIGTDLNGYALDDCAIDYLEQTPITYLKEDNILDAQGIKKITELTAQEKIKANEIRREEEKVIRKQNVEAREAILELDKQLAEKEEIQRREIASIKAREEAETQKIAQEERLKAERARITTEEEILIAEENKTRQIVVATKQRERTEAIETERVEKDRLLELNERERVVTLANIEKEKAVEEERKNIQDVIRERVIVEKATVEEEEKIKDTRALAQANRTKEVALIEAAQVAEEDLVKTVKEAEAAREAAKIEAEKRLIDADAAKDAAKKEGEAKKILAEALAAEEAALGVSEAQVMEAKALAEERKGTSEAKVIELKALARKQEGLADAEIIERKGLAEAKVIEQQALAKAKGEEQQALALALGIKERALAEAKGVEAKALAEAQGVEAKALAEAQGVEAKGVAEAKSIEQKAEAMKKLDGVGREHEEFKLRLEKEKAIELATINVDAKIAEAQAAIIAEALKSANIDIVGGETMFYQNIMNAIGRGKTIDRLVDNSTHLTSVKNALLADNANPIEKIKHFIGQFGLSTSDVRNLTVAAAIAKMSNLNTDTAIQDTLQQLLQAAQQSGIDGETLKSLGL